MAEQGRRRSVFGSRRRRQDGDRPVHAGVRTPGSSGPFTGSRDLAEAAPLYTLPMPYDVAADHESIIVFVTESGPIADFAGIQASCLERLAREASRRGCDAVYGVQQSMAASGDLVLISLLGTGSRPIPDLDQPPDIPGT